MGINSCFERVIFLMVKCPRHRPKRATKPRIRSGIRNCDTSFEDSIASEADLFFLEFGTDSKMQIRRHEGRRASEVMQKKKGKNKSINLEKQTTLQNSRRVVCFSKLALLKPLMFVLNPDLIKSLFEWFFYSEGKGTTSREATTTRKGTKNA